MIGLESPGLVGRPLNRVDGALKVTGAAAYPLDIALPRMAHAVLVQSTVTKGRIVNIATSAAERASGVILVVTHLNTPRLPRGPQTPLGPSPLPPLQGPEILHYGQHVAMVVAETLEEAQAAARLIEVRYEVASPILSFDDPRATPQTHPWLPDRQRGDVKRALDSAAARLDATYTTATNTNNPLGLFATVAHWDGDSLTVHDTTQWPYGVRESLAHVLGTPPERIRVLAPFVGGAFGAGLRVWPHVVLTAVAARDTKRPVKLVLSRAQMFTSIGNRPNSVQSVSLGATRSGELVAIEHESTSSTAEEDDVFEPVTMGTPEAYRCANVAVRDRQVRLNIPPPSWMRAPGHAEGSFALESAIDELSYVLGVDPLELRIRNYADVNPGSGLPWSSNGLLECYRQGADRFGWSKRKATPASMRSGRLLVGYGMAGVTYSFFQPACNARASVHGDGSAFVRSAGTDIGTGTYTVMTQLAGDLLGLPAERVRFGLGDTEMPMSPQQGGSGLTGAMGTAVHSACTRLVQTFVEMVSKDDRSPLRGCTTAEVTLRDGGIGVGVDPARFEKYEAILARHGLDSLTADGDSATPTSDKHSPAGAFAAHFVEVRVDPDLDTVRVARVVSAIDGGRILNPKTARSQVTGAIIGGIGMALLEETVTDEYGRLINASLGDYLVPVNADIGDIDVLFVGQPDPMTPIGTKGIGEVSLVAMAAAVANALYHATGARLRSTPLRYEGRKDT